MQEHEKIPIENVIVNDGTNEYNIDQIYSDKRLYSLTQKTINFKLCQPWNSYMIEKINSEGATLVINTDSQHEKNELSIRDSNAELTDEFYRIV